jgi:hypothetical protein
MLTTYLISLTNVAGAQSQIVQAKGNYIKYRKGSSGGASTRIRVRSGLSGVSVLLEPGEFMEIAETQSVFYIDNVDNVLALQCEIVIGFGNVGGDRIAGVVDVVDGGASRSRSGLAFGVAGYQSATAGNFSRVQLWNPAGSNRVAVVENILMTSGAGQVCSAWYLINGAALPNLVSVGQPKNATGISVIECRRDVTTSAYGGPAMGVFTVPNTATLPVPLKQSSPVVLSPGAGFLFYGTLLNADMGATFDYYEAPL